MIGAATPADSGWKRASRLQNGLIFLFAVVLMAPELVWGLSWSDSLPYNIVWTEQFTELVRAGDLYPRWLPESWDRLGSPTFYIYPPLYFWVASAIDLLTFRSLGVEHLVPATSLVFLACSGWAIRGWLAAQVQGSIPLLGAVAYMAAPYHLNDIYSRGAVAEAASYGLLPMVLLGLHNLAQRRRGSLALVALSYAALVLTHLPTALIASLFLFPWFVLFVAIRDGTGRGFLMRAAVAAALGLGLATFYLFPALLLGPFISYEALFASFYRPENWFIWYPERWPRLYPVAWTILVCSASVLILLHVSLRARVTRNAHAAFWCAIGLAAAIMATGLLPPLWELPLFHRVQFPSRFLLLVEFAVVTAAALGALRHRSPLVLTGATLWFAAVAGTGLIMMSTAGGEVQGKKAKIAAVMIDLRDAPEYLPPTFPLAYGKESGLPERSAIRLPDVPSSALSPALGRVSDERYQNGGARVLVDSPVGAIVTIRRFYFPHWRVTDGAGAIVPVEQSEEGLVRWRVPAGRSVYTVGHAPVRGENIGLVISAVSLALLFLAAFLLDRRRQMRQAVSSNDR